MENKLKELAYEIADFLDHHDLNMDTSIYFNNKALRSKKEGEEYNWTLMKDIKGSDYTEYANDKTITMTFEGIGSMYNIINGYENGYYFRDQFDELLEDYGYYYQLGNSWNLALYKM